MTTTHPAVRDYQRGVITRSHALDVLGASGPRLLATAECDAAWRDYLDSLAHWGPADVERSERRWLDAEDRLDAAIAAEESGAKP